ncbi:MAG: hypothetical protein IT161_06930 [Bryobacterales bacterium]|nr:hypothetical protein [Bryobacterales bacterium]
MNKITISALCLAAFGALQVSAQVWDANTTTGVPNFSPAGTVKTWTFDGGPNGKGVRPRPGFEGLGYAHLYIPVTAANATKFACIGLRSQDSNPGTSIRAEFTRQPRVAAGPAVIIGAVGSDNSGFQYRQAVFPVHALNYAANTYYIRVTFYTGPQGPGDVTAYDVSLLGGCTLLPHGGGESTETPAQ